MAKSDLKIKTTSPRGASMTTTVSYVNPYATNQQLATLGNRINQLTDNIYGHSEKVTTVYVDDEEGGGKTVPTVNFYDDDYTTSTSTIKFKIPSTQAGEVTIYCHYTGDAQPFIKIPECNIAFALKDDKEHRDGWFAVYVVSFGAGNPFVPGKYNVEFYFPETETYQEVYKTILLDAEE